MFYSAIKRKLIILKRELFDVLVCDNRGGYRKPNILDILWLQLLFSPYYVTRYVIWYLAWVWNYGICRHEYSEPDRQYLIRRYLRVTQLQWEVIS